MKKSTRTISGVTPVAVMTLPFKCPGRCVYCPDYEAMPRSYTPESPAAWRARQLDYDAGKQVKVRLQTLAEMGHPTDKVELIVMGGTFPACPEDYQFQFIKECYDALNGVSSSSLEEAKRLNETAEHRCVGLCIETRPDWCGPAEIERMLVFGVTRVELGVQAIDDEIYRLVHRGHTVAEVIKATALLKEHGFKVHYHLMPGLPGSTLQRDLAEAATIFGSPDFRPDGLKLYPTVVVKGTEMEKWYEAGHYKPYPDDVMVRLLVDIKAMVPKYVRISRVVRDIPPKFIRSGLKASPRVEIKELMRQRNLECHCIRCREYGHRVRDGRAIGEPRLTRLDYDASGGKEVFLSFEDGNETLFGLLRLRIQDRPEGEAGDVRQKMALIRELHVYGPEVALSQRYPGSAQHRGLGKALLKEAERIAAEEFKSPEISVLSGVGAREYYRELGYNAEGDYMVKGIALSLRRT